MLYSFYSSFKLELVPTVSITPEDAKKKAEMLVASGVSFRGSKQFLGYFLLPYYIIIGMLIFKEYFHGTK